MSSTVPRSDEIHPFLRGNFAPVDQEYLSHPCHVTGEIPIELLGGQYIRNGGNPVYPPEKGRHYHWFDGDGMLHGVLFPITPDSTPLYTNRHLATPLLTLTLLFLRSPIPSIALLISPLSSLHKIIAAIVQAFLILLRARMGVLSVANTSVLWWGQGMGKEAEEEASVERSLDKPQLRRTVSMREYRKDHRLLATCESGPPLEVRVPELETVAWDRLKDGDEDLSRRRGRWSLWKRWGIGRVQEDWMTAHPRIDPIDGSLIFYSTQMFEAPHVRYSVIDRKGKHLVWKEGIDVGRAKMMHDFAATRTHSILLNLPLTLSPHNLFSIPPVPLIHFDRSLASEFVIIPRLYQASTHKPIRFIEPEPSLIFHTANAWNEEGNAINMLSSRFISAKLVYAAGAVDIPKIEKQAGEDDVVRLHYHRFVLPEQGEVGTISHSFPLSIIPFEFPVLPPDLGMSASRYIYGCTMKSGSFDERLGGAAKVDCIVKLNVEELIRTGRERGEGRNIHPVDQRNVLTIVDEWKSGVKGPIEVFVLPDGWYAQEPRFVPRLQGGGSDEDDGYLLSYVYDEAYLLENGTPDKSPEAGSELWVIDAKRMGEGMTSVVCRVKLPQRVPYGLHGTYLPPSLTRQQRPLATSLPTQSLLQDKLALSRIQHFVSIIFHRPTSREKSKFETAVLAIMIPAAIGFLTLALSEVFLSWYGATYPLSTPIIDTRDDATNGLSQTNNSTRNGQLDVERQFPWPQAASGILVVISFFICFPKFKSTNHPSSPSASTPPLQDL